MFCPQNCCLCQYCFRNQTEKSIFNLLNVFGINFENVVKVYDMCNRAYKNQPTYFYTAKNIGIIRKEFPDINQIWNLKRFKIIQ